jgi:hypothetical protein
VTTLGDDAAVETAKMTFEEKRDLALNITNKGMDLVDSAVDSAIDWKADAGDAVADGAAAIASAVPPPWGPAISIGIKGLNTLTKIGGNKISGFDGNTGSSAMADFSTADK